MKILGLLMVAVAVGYMVLATLSHQDETMAKCQQKLSYDACFQILNR
jgi:hypothetical protein